MTNATLRTGARGGTRKPKSEAADVADSSSRQTKALSKQESLAALLVRDEGATLEQMIAATGWLPHTTRAAMTVLRKKGYVIESDKVDGVRTYRAVSPK